MPQPEEQIENLKKAIAIQESLRSTLGDVVVDTTIAAIREQLSRLGAQVSLPEQQRKQVTVLFADVSNFTAMSESLDAEDVAEVMNALWARLDAAITAHGGKIDKHIGDCVMALWGVEAAREDDPERAIKAALVIQAEIRDFVEMQNIASLQMRIGLNTGPVLLGEVGSTHEFTAMGDTVNLASRMEHAAPMGGILISHDTYRHVRGVFDVLPQAPLQVKGKAELVQTYVVQQAKPRAFQVSTRGVEGVETRMIGRDAELKRLQEAFYTLWDTARGELQMITVAGGAGVGKSRLLHEFRIWAELRPETYYIFTGRATQETQSLPYALLRDVFSFRFQIQDSDTLPEVKEKMQVGVGLALGESEGSRMRAHFIGQLLGFDLADSSYIKGIRSDARQIHDRALAYASDYFKGLAARQPIVILFEDVHWADDSSLDAINYLAQALVDQPLLVICAARPELLERYPHWGTGQAFHACLELRPLSKRDSRRLVNEVLRKADDVPDALRELVVSYAEGNPFYVEELIKMLIEDGVILKGAERWRVEPTRLAGIHIPPTLIAVLQARLDRLPPKEKITLQQAAVVGHIFWDAAVVYLNAPQAVSLSETTAALGTLRDQEMIFQHGTSGFVGTREYIFKHALLRDATYESVLKRMRRTYHARAAEWLITNSGDRAGEIAGLIAEHLEQAGQAKRAAGYLRQAGERALTTSAYREAVGYLERALALLPAANRDRIPLLVQVGDALIFLGEYMRAREQLQTGLTLGQMHGDDGNCAEILTYLARIAEFQGDWGGARAYLTDSLGLARRLGDRGRIAYALLNLGYVDMSRGAYVEARAQIAESQALYQALGEKIGLARALSDLGMVAHLLGEYEEAKALYLEGLALYREVGNRNGEGVNLVRLGEATRQQRDYTEARRYCEKGLAIAREIGAKLLTAITLGNLGHITFACGDYSKAGAYYREAIHLKMSLRAIPTALESLTGLAGVLAQTGRPEQALEVLGQVLHHPAAMDESRPIVEQVLAILQAKLPPETVEAGLARGAARALDEVAQEALAESRIDQGKNHL